MARMLGDVAQSWCPSCSRPPGPDCPDVGKGTRAAKRIEQRATAAEIDDLIGGWHDAPEGSPASLVPLHEYLGMTSDEYDEWVTGA